MRIALDAMAGDFGPEPLVQGAIQAVEESNHHIILVGHAGTLENILTREHALHPRLSIHHADRVVGMGDSPKASLRMKTSSIAVAADLVRDGEAEAIVSAGNTGATLATTVQRWHALESVSRPSLATVIPIPSHPAVLLDVGANIDCRPNHLLDFAIMGSVYAREIFGRRTPRVGLLNIGAEEGKGNDQAQSAWKLLNESDLNFIGNVEGGDVFSGRVDVIVTDGFVGNVVLKFGEGMFGFMTRHIKQELTRNAMTKLGGLPLLPIMRRLKRSLDSSQRGGAPLLGLNGICIVSHGASGAEAIKNAVKLAAECVRQDINGKITLAMRGKGK